MCPECTNLINEINANGWSTKSVHELFSHSELTDGPLKEGRIEKMSYNQARTSQGSTSESASLCASHQQAIEDAEGSRLHGHIDCEE